MKQVLDWSRPITWVVVGAHIVFVGVVVMTASGNEEGIGRVLVVVGAMFVLIGFLAYLVTQIRKAAAAAKDQ